MPFTAAHPAIALPLLGRLRVRYGASALVVGTMAPDFEYFVRLRPAATLGHTLVGLVLFCLPTGALVLAVFHVLVKRPAILLLPDAIRCRLAGTEANPRLRLSDAVANALLIVAGAATHLAWDSFTHAGGWAVRYWPALSAVVVTVLEVDIATYKLLQHASTLLGLGAIVLVTAHWLRRRPRATSAPGGFAPRVRWAIVGAIVMASIAAGAAWAAAGPPGSTSGRAFQLAAGRFVVAAVAGFAGAVLLYSLAAMLGRRASTSGCART